MAADFQLIEGQTLPVFEDVLTYSNGKAAEPESVVFVMRSLAATEALKLSGTASVVTKAEGKVSFTPAAADTKGKAGSYMACWEATIGGKVMTFPTVGFLSVEVQPSLTAKGIQQLVSLPEVKQHMYVGSVARTEDDVLVRMIEVCRPLIEERTGPIIPTTYDEWYEGGTSSISLRHKPSYGYGTSPIFRILAVSEYRGPIEYNIAAVGTPTQGSVYSEMAHGELGTIVRRTSGGGTYEWWSDPSHPAQSVHVLYEVGQETVPPNVRFAVCETVRWWVETTQPTGKGSQVMADMESMKPNVALPYHVTAMLQPTARHPSLA